MTADPTEVVARYAVVDRGVPHLRASFIASLDGAATVAGLSGGLNDAWDKQVLDTLRTLADVLLVGAGTLRAEGYGALRLDDDAVARRRALGLPDHPVLAVVSGRLDLEPGNPALADAPVRPLVLTRASAPTDRRAALARVADVVDCGADAVEGRWVRAALVGRGLPQILCEGGPTLLGSLLADDVVDELCLTVAPVLVAGDAPRIAGGAGEAVRRMRLLHAVPGGPMLFLRYRRDRDQG